MKKVEALIGVIFFIVGIGMLIGGIVLGNAFNEKKNNWVETTAIIEDIQYYGRDEHRVIVQYEVNGRTMEARLDSYDSSMYEGDEVAIFYDPQNPSNISATSQQIANWILLGMGVIFTLIGGGLTITKLKGKSKKESLMQNGECVGAEINEVQLNRGYRVNGRSPFVIICRWRDPQSGEYYLFGSENLWYDPRPILAEKQLTTLPVYLDPQNYKRYYVSTEEIDVKDLT